MVSSFGRIRSLPRRVRNKHSFKMTKDTIRKLYFKDNYCRVNLSINDISKMFTVHSLVAEAFLGERPKGIQINHIDCNKLNNNINNLEYVTPKENMEHAASHGLLKNKNQPKGENQGSSKLKEKDVLLMRKLSSEYKVRNKTLSWLFNIDKTTSSGIILGKAWRHLL